MAIPFIVSDHPALFTINTNDKPMYEDIIPDECAKVYQTIGEFLQS
ncbi:MULTISPECIES: hypothetical protein [Vibrio]|uniref:Uncharacterized protein n=1 Tax=Vibrio algicola TaxID=2662262 RepID=A0A5Q0TAU3_9VIBR|nr:MULTISPECIES: hypothetical protein [Vibrio]MBD1576549.1 hypothetical protein [Vibrio sp. S11_S32]